MQKQGIVLKYLEISSPGKTPQHEFAKREGRMGKKKEKTQHPLPPLQKNSLREHRIFRITV